MVNPALDDESTASIRIEATILANAIQTCIFGPSCLGRDLPSAADYSALPQDKRRWPLANHPQGEELHIGIYGAHDIHQAVLLFYPLVTRRKITGSNPI